MKKRIIYFVLALNFLGCATSTEEGAVGIKRKQFFAIPSEQVNEMSYQQYDQLKADSQKKGTLDKNPQYVQRVQAVAKRIIPQTGIFKSDATGWPWETHVITSDEVNAFCMPGGKIMFYSGIIEKLKLTDAEIAAVMGHEISHALREHGRERISKEMVQQGLLGVGVVTGKISNQQAQIASMLLTVGVMLPHDRTQETEADEMGLELMARAGYNPESALSLWKKMGSLGGSKPPEFLSTHPSDDRRLSNLESLMSKVVPLYEKSAKAPQG
jgi:predicted Zn-dependent protease